MIGNDIIDRQAIRPRSPAHWDRFREKTMTKSEQEILADFRKDQLDIWLAWAVKESVYKLEYQFNPKRYFTPKKIEVQSLKKARGKLGTYWIDLKWNTDYIHALAWAASTHSPKSMIFLNRPIRLDKLITSHLQDTFPERAFSIQKNLFPQIQVDQKTFWPLSKSHHGRWIAFAYQTG
jgi:phosphopantetheinyl transferase (holo-ACP synthase)